MRIPIFSVLLLAIGLGAALAYAEARPRLSAALIMTAGQKNSSLPTDAGLFIHDGSAVGWQRFGPKIQFINSMEVSPLDPARVFLACGNGVARTRDGGASWKLVTGWRESDIMDLAIDPVDDATIYAATIWGPVVSRDGGDTWSYAMQGLPEPFCRVVVIDRRDRNRILLGSDAGVFESRDRAAAWNPVTLGPGVNILDLKQSQADPDRWLAGTELHGAFLSRDNGHTWSPVLGREGSRNVYAVGFHPENADVMVLGGWGMGVWLSEDGGATWSDRGRGLPSNDVTAVVIAPEDADYPGRLWASTFELSTFFSDDRGQTWEDANLPGAYVYELKFVELE